MQTVRQICLPGEIGGQFGIVGFHHKEAQHHHRDRGKPPGPPVSKQRNDFFVERFYSKGCKPKNVRFIPTYNMSSL